jgi:hypothetical protein
LSQALFGSGVLFVQLSSVCHTCVRRAPKPLLDAGVRLGGLSYLFSLLYPTHPLGGNGGCELYHTFLNGLAMGLGELQPSNPSEALVPSIGSKRRVRRDRPHTLGHRLI